MTFSKDASSWLACLGESYQPQPLFGGRMIHIHSANGFREIEPGQVVIGGENFEVYLTDRGFLAVRPTITAMTLVAVGGWQDTTYGRWWWIMRVKEINVVEVIRMRPEPRLRAFLTTEASLCPLCHVSILERRNSSVPLVRK